MTLQLDGIANDDTLDDDKVNNGVWVHLDGLKSDPETNKKLPMFLGGDESKPQRVLVRSYRCKAIKDAEAKLQKAYFARMRVSKKKQSEKVDDDLNLSEEARFSIILAGLDNFSKSGGVQMLDPASALELHGMSELDNIIRQVKAISLDDEYYIAGADTEAGNAEASKSEPTRKSKT